MWLGIEWESTKSLVTRPFYQKNVKLLLEVHKSTDTRSFSGIPEFGSSSVPFRRPGMILRYSENLAKFRLLKNFESLSMRRRMRCWSPWATSFPVTLLWFAPGKWIHFILMFAADWTTLAPFFKCILYKLDLKGAIKVCTARAISCQNFKGA